MKKILFCLLLGSISSLAQASEVGFVPGNEFTSIYLEGDVTVNCSERGRRDFAAFRCRGEILDPAAFAKFQGPVNTGANAVVLRATREDGSVKDAKESYDNAKGISKRFNLWVSTLLQRPLLKPGRNAITYYLMKGKDVKAQGNFVATVNQGEDRRCRRRGHYYSYNLSDCRSSFHVCGQYFRDQNYCQ